VRTKIKIRLSHKERGELRRIVRKHNAPYREVLRAKMILLLAKNVSFCEVSRQVGVARRIVYKWANRFNKDRLAGLKDRPRSGRPARFSPDRVDVSGEACVRTSG